jgi:hypothetical protein
MMVLSFASSSCVLVFYTRVGVKYAENVVKDFGETKYVRYIEWTEVVEKGVV